MSALAGAAFEAAGLDASFGEVVVGTRPELGQFQCNGALSAARAAGRSPRDIATEVAATMTADPRIGAAEVAGPGFINLTVTDTHLAETVEEMAANRTLGVDSVPAPRRVVVDYGGPNVAKDLHVGHLRPALIGESVKRLLRSIGHDTIGDVHLGDWGAPMGQLIAEVELRYPDLAYFDADFSGPYPSEPPVPIADLQEMYPEAAARTRSDSGFAVRAHAATAQLQEGRPGYRALWSHFRAVTVDALREVYDDLGVTFELWLGESSVHDRIAPMVERLQAGGIAQISDGALIVEVSRPDDTHEIPPLILVRSDGGFLYSTSDLATIEERVEDLGATEIIYVVDLRQALHFEQVFRAARRGGIAPDTVILDHAGNGTVNGPDGRPFKTREGDLPGLRHLIAEVIARAVDRLDENHLAEGYPEEERSRIARLVGLAALKFGDLSNHRASNYVFDLDRFTSFQGRTGPYLLYVTSRSKSLLRKAALAALEPGPIIAPSVEVERRLMLELTRLPEAVHRAAELRAPNHIAEYAYELAGSFNRFYDCCHILTEPDPDRQRAWLGLVTISLATIEMLLDLLVIETPERM